MVRSDTRSHAIGAAVGVSAVDELVLATVNAPYKRDISADVLQECIAKADLGKWSVHIATFFTDVEPFLVFRFADAHGISTADLAKTYIAMKAATGERNPNLETELVRLAPAS